MPSTGQTRGLAPPWWLLLLAVAAATAAGLVLTEGASPLWWVATVVSVALALAVMGALAGSQPVGEHLVLLSMAWSVGSVAPWLANLHRGAAVVVLAATVLPDPRRAPWRWAAVLLCGALLAVPNLAPWLAVAVLLVAGGLLAVQRGPVAAPAAVGLLLVAAGQAAAAVLVPIGPGAADLGRLCYAAGFLGGMLVGTQAARRGRWGVLELAWPGPEDLAQADPLAVVSEVLRHTLADRTLRVDLADGPRPQGSRVVEVGGVPWVWISSDRGVLDDADTWQAVRQLVAQVGAHRQLVEAERVRARDVSESRSRLLAAADRERREVAETLRERVLVPLRGAAGFLGSVPLLAVELQTAVREVEALLVGQSPFRLGAGAVVPAVQEIAARSPVPVRLDTQDVCADEATEQAVWAVVSEGLTNAWKHSHASEVGVRVAVDGVWLIVVVDDDGVGGAVPSGRGLLGLTDRASALGGSFRVEDRRPRGTSVCARLPYTPLAGATPPIVEVASGGSRA